MMTPQEVASHSFAKATLGGYNLAMVDEFLDALTEDYTALYNENAILKNKLKVLSDRVEEYRATEETMRKTLLAAQQMADAMMDEARHKRDELIGTAQQDAQRRMDELDKAVAAEEYRLRQAQESTAAYVRKLAQFHDQEMELLAHLGDLVPPELADRGEPAGAPAEEPAAPAGPSVHDTAVYPVQAEEPEQPEAQPVPDAGEEVELDPDATRRYSDLKFGKDYEIQ